MFSSIVRRQSTLVVNEAPSPIADVSSVDNGLGCAYELLCFTMLERWTGRSQNAKRERSLVRFAPFPFQLDPAHQRRSAKSEKMRLRCRTKST